MSGAWMFPGQGSQIPGMGHRLMAEFPRAKETIRTASRISGIDLDPIRSRGPAEAMRSPQVAEPLIASLQIAYAEEFLHIGSKPQYVAGYSAGEVAAYYAAEVLDRESAIKAAVIRGNTLARYVDRDSRMIAVAKVSRQQIELAIEELRVSIEFAAFNAADHFTLVGVSQDIVPLTSHLMQLGAVVTEVQVAGPWHSAKIRSAVDEIDEGLKSLVFEQPSVPLYLSATGASESNPVRLRRALAEQIASPVMWHPIMAAWRSLKVNEFIEMGPGRVLQGILRHCWPNYSDYVVTCVESASGSIQSFKRLLSKQP